jgi:DNA-binding PadR family transcriptional regulator
MIDEFDERDIDILMNELLEKGLIEIYGIESETEEFTYRITEKCKEEFPELFQEHFSFINSLAFKLWTSGYIEMQFDEDGSPMVMLKDLDYYNEIFPKVSQEERTFLENMIYFEANKGDII